jgi:hypothetical protein
LYRQNKIFTDVVGVHNYSGVESQNEDLNENGILDIKEKVEGTLMYRAGGGDMDYWMSDGSRLDAGDPYTFLIGGIATIRFVAVTEENIIFADWNMNNQDIGISEKSPLPLASCGGDSGTANYVYNEETGRYEYFFSLRAGNFTTYSVGHGSIDFANESMAKYSREVDMTETHTAYLNAVTNGTGTLTVGDTEIEHLAVNSGTHTWKDLSGVKDQANWFAYGNGYMNSVNGLGSTHNLLFDGGNTDNTIILNATVDTGVGYLEFNNGSFIIKNADGGNYTLNSAGYVVNKGAEVHLQLTNDANYMREWRKNGEGDLYIEGSGDNNILLALGGSGTTYLNRENGYAAYNVMAASGATVVIKDINQIERDFTFGLNGAVQNVRRGKDYYKSCYLALINSVRASSPDTKIILQSAPPVAANMDMSNYSVDVKKLNEHIDTINSWSLELAEEEGLGYLNTAEILKNEVGELRPELQVGDGHHLTAEAYTEMLNYIRTHGYK